MLPTECVECANVPALLAVLVLLLGCVIGFLFGVEVRDNYWQRCGTSGHRASAFGDKNRAYWVVNVDGSHPTLNVVPKDYDIGVSPK